MPISVCIPTFNQGPYLEQCIRSVMGQTVRPDEVIVSNDCSTDETRAILDRLSQEFDILHVIHQEHNLGMVKNTNTCLQTAQYEFIVKLDSDDYLLPRYVEALSGLLKQHPEAGYAHGSVQEIDGDGHKGKVRRLHRPTGFQTSPEALRASCNGYQVAANIIMFRKAALEAAAFITSRVHFAEDFFLSVEIANAGFGNAYTPEVLSCYRVWADAGNVRQRRKLNEINGLRIIFDEPLRTSFTQRGWSLRPLEKKKEQFACTHADCLQWRIYTQPEKDELEAALYQLSATPKVKLYTFLYKSGFGGLIDGPTGVLNKAKQAAKSLLAAK